MSQKYDAIVVGGGHNGLVAAHYLAQSELKVLVLERRYVVGGPCCATEFFPGYRGSVCNSPGSLEPKIVSDMELERFGLTFDRPDPSLIHPFPDGRAFIAWREKERVNEELRKFSENDAKVYHEIVNTCTELAKKLELSLFEPPPSLSDLFSRLHTPEDEATFTTLLFGNVKDFLDDRLETDQVKAVLACMCMFGGNYPPSAPGSPFVLLQRPMSLASMSIEADHDPRKQPLRGSTGLPRGSMGSVTEAMERSIMASGVEVRTEADVASIKVNENGRVQGVVLADGEEIDAGMVISNLHPKTTLLNLVERQHVEGPLRTRLEQLKVRGCAFKVALALNDVPRFAAAPPDAVDAFASCQYRIAPDMEYLEQCVNDAKSGIPSRSPRLMGLTPSMVDPSLAPPGKHLMSISVYYAPYQLREGDWTTEKERFGQRVIDTLAEYVPNLKDIIEDTRFDSPKDLEDEYGLVEGHGLHADMSPGGMFSLRPVAGLSEYRTPVRGLYLCGAGTWPGGFITGIPGHNGSHQALGDYALGLDSKEFAKKLEPEYRAPH